DDGRAAQPLSLLAIEAWLRSERDAAIYEQDIRRDQRILGRALEGIAESMWRLHGLTQARQLVEDTARREPEVDIRLLDEATALHDPQLAADADAWNRDEPVQLGEPTVLRTYLRIDGPDGERHALAISTSLRGEEAHLSQGLRDFGVIALALLAVATLLAGWLGRQLVGRRIDRLVELTQRVGRGDFVHVESRELDEIGELGRALNEMADTLASARVALEEETRARIAATEHLRRSERLATVGTLAAGLAHELGTPLHVVAGRARMIAEAPEADRELAADARVIVEQAARLQRIIEQLLDFARPRRAERRHVLLGDVLRADLDLLAPILQRRQVKADLSAASPGGARVFADPDQLRQVFTNILMNAAHAMPGGGKITVRIDADLPPPVGLEGAERFARVQIHDQGVGIAPADLDRIFDPFFTTKRVGEGTGLGLAVAHGIISDHGGVIAVDSRPGEGSTFTVWLPMEESP
ncbi:MAG TPA: ATP-binding protein, partial [Nannocystaceae bacterium]|nr:ATP-binding protein [Nannocystaceae bacterium]